MTRSGPGGRGKSQSSVRDRKGRWRQRAKFAPPLKTVCCSSKLGKGSQSGNNPAQASWKKVTPRSRAAVRLPGSIPTISKGAGSEEREGKTRFLLPASCFPLSVSRSCFSYFSFPLFAYRLFAFKWLLGLFTRKDQPVRLLLDVPDQRIQLGNECP